MRDVTLALLLQKVLTSVKEQARAASLYTGLHGRGNLPKVFTERLFVSSQSVSLFSRSAQNLLYGRIKDGPLQFLLVKSMPQTA